VGTIHGGTKNNIIPDEVTMGLTLRTFSPGVRDQIVADVRRTANGLAEAYGRQGCAPEDPSFHVVCVLYRTVASIPHIKPQSPDGTGVLAFELGARSVAKAQRTHNELQIQCRSRRSRAVERTA